MPELTAQQHQDLEIARQLIRAGWPIFLAYPQNTPGRGEFIRPNDWQHTRPNEDVIDRWRPGMALCMVTGVAGDILDTDPRNGGDESRSAIVSAGDWPRVYGCAQTPSGGSHEIIHRTHVAKGAPVPGIDLQAGQDDGEGRGYVYIAPTVRTPETGPNAGVPTAYRWCERPNLGYMAEFEQDDTVQPITDMLLSRRAARKSPTPRAAAGAVRSDDDEAFDTVDSYWSAEAANRVITGQLEAVRKAREGAVNSALGGAARVLGRFVAGGYLDEDAAMSALLHALKQGGVHSDSWNAAHGRDWTANTCILAGMARGASEPWDVIRENAVGSGRVADLEPESHSALDGGEGGSGVEAGVAGATPASSPASPRGLPALQVTSAADMAYWLQAALGTGALSGFFERGGQMVHTPRVDEVGYVPPKNEADDNGPAQIQAINPGQLAAKIQFSHRCYKLAEVKDEAGKRTGEKREVNALFPTDAARRAVDAPEFMTGLRPLRGITHTPMVRRDGSVLATPGYDASTGYLFLPGQGVDVKGVPDSPDDGQVAAAVALLNAMVAGFPWVSPEDKVNYFGYLLTPLLRQICPPSYKLFAIGAHQPGSGKTLLADIGVSLHGGVLRTEVPEDEPEWRKQTTSILATTSAPVVMIDNVTGVLKSSVLAGLLTASAPTSDRLLGTSDMVTTVNDRVWVITGNNLSLGGDLVRRTITVMIDPNMANPETRSFAITDLNGWVKQHRNDLLHALLTMVRYWVSAGRPLAQRAQSDSFAVWEATVAGILAVCGVQGAFDAQSGQRAAKGGDDDGLAGVLEHIWHCFEDKPWSASEALRGSISTDFADFAAGSRDWLPSVVLDRLARSEESGKKTFGHWLRNRLGRWVTTDEGAQYVLRSAGKDRMGAIWKVERLS